MAERIFIRKLQDNSWQWRVLEDDALWQNEPQAESNESLAKVLADWRGAQCVLLPGELVTTRNLSTGTLKKNLLTKLLPYEIEDQLIDPVEKLHFTFGEVHNGRVNIAYMDIKALQDLIEQLDPVGSELSHIFAEYSLLRLDGAEALFLLEGEQLIAKFATGIGFTAEVNIAPIILQNLSQNGAFKGANFRLVADSVESYSTLLSCFPEEWENEGITFDERMGSYWDYLDLDIVRLPLNLRSGACGRQLPLARWWQTIKVPSYLAAATFVFAVGVTYFDYLASKSQGTQLRENIQQLYLQAVPNGRPGDEENKLKSLLAGSGSDTTAEPSNLMLLLSGFTKGLEQKKDIKLSNFRYNGDQKELQVNIEVTGLEQLSEFRELLAGQGLDTGSPRTSLQGEIYQANMKIVEKTP